MHLSEILEALNGLPPEERAEILLRAKKAYKKLKAKEYQRAHYLRNKEKVLARSADRYARVKDDKNAASRKAYAQNPEAKKAKNLAGYYAHKQERMAARKRWLDANREAVREKARKYARDNPEIVQSNTRKRTANKLQATPGWANPFFMREAFALAKLRARIAGGSWHVDHIVPLRSKIVCGLHCEQNLAVIPEKDNRAKNNRYWPDMP